MPVYRVACSSCSKACCQALSPLTATSDATNFHSIPRAQNGRCCQDISQVRSVHLEQAGYVQPLGSYVQQLVGQTPVYAPDCLHLACIKAQAPLQAASEGWSGSATASPGAILFRSGFPNVPRQQCNASSLFNHRLPRYDGGAQEVQREHPRQRHIACNFSGLRHKVPRSTAASSRPLQMSPKDQDCFRWGTWWVASSV